VEKKPQVRLKVEKHEQNGIVDFGFGGKTGHVFCLPIYNPSFVILSL